MVSKNWSRTPQQDDLETIVPKLSEPKRVSVVECTNPIEFVEPIDIMDAIKGKSDSNSP